MKHYVTLIIILLVTAITSPAATRKPKKTARQAKMTKTVKAEPRTSGPFVVRLDTPEAPAGLDGKKHCAVGKPWPVLRRKRGPLAMAARTTHGYCRRPVLR